MQLELLVNKFNDLKLLRSLNYLGFGESNLFLISYTCICGVLMILSLVYKIDS